MDRYRPAAGDRKVRHVAGWANFEVTREGPWLTSERTRADAHKLRAEVDAILIGAGTLRADNPRLTVRLGKRNTLHPWRVVLTRSGNLPPDAHLFTDQHRERTLVYKKRSLGFVLRDLGRRGVASVLIEGGSDILGQAFEQGLVDRVQFYIAPLILGGPKTLIGARLTVAPVIENPAYKRIGHDLRLTGDVRQSD